MLLSDHNHECVGECGTVAARPSPLSPILSPPLSPSCFHLAAELSRTLMKVGRGSKEGKKGGSIYSFSSRQPTNMLCGRAHSLARSLSTQGLPSFLHPLFHYRPGTNTCSRTSVREGGHDCSGLKAPTKYRERRGTDAMIRVHSLHLDMGVSAARMRKIVRHGLDHDYRILILSMAK